MAGGPPVGANLKDGQQAEFQSILIDGQQRVTALRSAVAGLPVVDRHYRKVRIRIAFNPVTHEFILPKDHLQKNGYPDRTDYNQIANFALTETSINISIGNRSPAQYMAEVQGQVDSGRLRLGEIVDPDDLARNLAENALPPDLSGTTAATYRDFLARRRVLMAQTIRQYFEGL